MQDTGVPSLGEENPLEEEMATHSRILAWSVPWTEEPDRLPSMGSKRVRHNWATFTSIHMCSRALSCWLLHVSLMTVACHEYNPILERKKWKSEGFRASHVTQSVKNLPAMQDTWVWFLGWEDPLEKKVATHTSTLPWRIHGQRSLAGYRPWDDEEWTRLSD